MFRKALLVSLLSVGLMACTSNEIGASLTAFKGLTVSNEQVISESRAFTTNLDKHSKVASSKSKYTKRLNKLTKGLKNYNGLDLNFKVYMDSSVNAFATADGSVRVNSGLMDMMNDNEVVAVIGHEIGHVAEQHSLKQMKKAYLASGLRQGLEAQGGTTGNMTAALGDFGEAFLGAQFSQSDELSSDKFGLDVLSYTKRNLQAAVTAQEKLATLGGNSSFMSSHPASSKRAEVLTEEIKKRGAK